MSAADQCQCGHGQRGHYGIIGHGSCYAVSCHCTAFTPDLCQCGHAKNQHIPQCTDEECWGVEVEYVADSNCHAFTPDSEATREDNLDPKLSVGASDARCPSQTVRQDAETAWEQYTKGLLAPPEWWPQLEAGFIAGYLAAKGDADG